MDHRIWVIASPLLITPAVALAQGGDGPADATVIPGLPFSDTGTTVGYTDDADAVCPYTGSTSPDVFYSYTPSSDELLTIDLCDAGFDTKTYVFDSLLQLATTLPLGAPACNDDFCTSANGGAFRSLLSCVVASAGTTYFIVVDGWQGDAGTYQLDVGPTDPADCTSFVCLTACPPGSTVEPDDCAFGDPAPNDLINGGCNATPPTFMDIADGVTICGTAYFDGTFRDTDWFRFEDPGACEVQLSIFGEAEFTSIVGVIDNGGIEDCSAVVGFWVFVVTPCHEPIALSTASMAPGAYWLFMAADFSQVIDCNQPAGGPPAEVGDGYVLVAYNEPYCGPCPWDFNGDNEVGFADLLKILSNWGPCP